MGSYATTTSISTLIPGFLRGNTTTSDTAGVAIFSAHVDRAEGLVNSYVAARYALPLSPVPPLLRTLTEDIACYYAFRGALSQDGQRKNTYIEEYKQALSVLDDLKKGDVRLAYTDGSLVPVASSSRFLSSSEGYTPVFGKDDPEQWGVDSDESDDLEDARA